MATSTTSPRTTRKPTAATKAPAKKAPAKKAPAKKAPASKASATKATAPAASKARLPKVNLPKVNLPTLNVPTVNLPRVELPTITVPEQLTTAQQHVVAAAKQLAARLSDRLDPTHRRTVALQRVDRAQHGALEALEGLMTRTEAVRSKVELPFAEGVRTAVHSNAEFVATLARRQVEFGERVVKTLVPAA